MTVGVVLRSAVPADVDELLRVEREANLPALHEVFPPDEFPYPDAEVRDRWARVLRDPCYDVMLAVDDGALVGFVAWRGAVVEHLGVHPSVQRRGLAGLLLARAVPSISPELPSLWVLVDNAGARAFYTQLGWRATGRARRAEFPPYPHEVELRAPDPSTGDDAPVA